MIVEQICPFCNGERIYRKTLPLLLAFSFVIATMAGCASLPNPNINGEEDILAGKVPKIAGPRGLLTTSQSKAILAKVDAQAGRTDILQQHVIYEEKMVGSPLSKGNKAILLRDGPSTYAAMFKAIENAKHHINLETYIFEDDETGKQFTTLLIEKRKQGLQVNIIYDSVGSLNTGKEFFDECKKVGIRVVEFNPVNPLNVKKSWSLNHRDHRKILVVDGAIAFTGGINISEVYSSGSSGGSKSRPGNASRLPREQWRDTQIQIEGPVVREFQKIFLETWKHQHGDLLEEGAYFPEIKEKGSELVRAIASSPEMPLNPMYATFISAITRAQETAYITNAYFAPDPHTLAAITDAARRGVDVKLILPNVTDSWLVFYAGHYHYTELLEAGVKIYERRDALLHAKTAVIDGVWSTVGSTNLDWRSVVFNNEINAVILGTNFADEMEAMFQQDLIRSTEIELTKWKQRPFTSRFKEWISHLWERWL